MKSVGVAGKADWLYVACTPNNARTQAFAQMFSEGTMHLRASGGLADILEKYGLLDWRSTAGTTGQAAP